MTKVESLDQQVDCSIERVDPVHVRIRVIVPASAVDAAVQQAFARIARSARVPGFRPGRVPKPILEKQFWPVVRAEVEKELVSESFEKALQGCDLRLTGDFHLEQVSLNLGEPLSYSAIVEVWPEIERVQFEGLEVEVPRAVVTEDRVEAVLLELQERHTKLVPILDRDTVQVGDVVELSMEQGAGPGARERNRRELVWLKESVAESPFAPLIGKRVGERVEIELPQESASPGTDSSPKVWRARIDKVFAREVPPLDQDFARTVSSTAETVEDLRAQIRQELEVRAERQRAALVRSRLRKALVDANPGLVVPPSLLRLERDQLARSYVMSLGLAEARAEEFVRRNPALAERLEDEAYVRTASEILLATLAQQQAITVSDAEVDEFLDRSVQEVGEEAARIRARYAEGEARERLRRELVLQRALELVQRSANVRDVSEDAQIAEPSRNG
ncbi:Trigger factor [bacterium HR30]|nr:Trigger factor [bacterium HR30]